MQIPAIKCCPGTLAPGFDTYSRTCLNRVFFGRKVPHILPYDAPQSNGDTDHLFEENVRRMSISGVQEKFSVVLEKNAIRLCREGERGTHILKPAPLSGKKPGQMPANEHLTMQIARQVYGIETAENALIFFRNGSAAYITRRFDVKEPSGGSGQPAGKRAQDDFASLAGRTPQTHGENYKYKGNYLELFQIMETHLPAYRIEAPKLFKLLIFNYLFSNGDAHFKNFSITETPLGDYRLSPAYDLLNSRLHIDDNDFALEEGLLPPRLAEGSIRNQFLILAGRAGIQEKMVNDLIYTLSSGSARTEQMIAASYLDEATKGIYWSMYLRRLGRIA
jgi:serine/threonine-protein kinase HipA